MSRVPTSESRATSFKNARDSPPQMALAAPPSDEGSRWQRVGRTNLAEARSAATAKCR